MNEIEQAFRDGMWLGGFLVFLFMAAPWFVGIANLLSYPKKNNNPDN